MKIARKRCFNVICALCATVMCVAMLVACGSGSVTVTEEEWNAAFTTEAFTNVSIAEKMTQPDNSDENAKNYDEYYLLFKVDQINERIYYSTYHHNTKTNINDQVFYMIAAKIEDAYYLYELGTGQTEWSVSKLEEYEYSRYLEEVVKAVSLAKYKYSDFVYSDEDKAYVQKSEQSGETAVKRTITFEQIKSDVKGVGGKRITKIIDETNESNVLEISFYAYGETEVDVPDVKLPD